MSIRMNFIEAAKRVLEEHYPGYACAFVAGSMLRGEETAKSDIDITVIFSDDFEDIHRNSIIAHGWPVELFVQNSLSLDYFFEQDRRRGMRILMNMVANGIALPGETDLVIESRKKAQAVIAAGPPALTQIEIEDRLYFLNDLLDDLNEGRPKLETYGTLAKLYSDLGDFHLRSKGQWSGHGKALGRIIRQGDPAFANQYEQAFRMAFDGDFMVLARLADSVMAGFNGRYWAGHRRAAPDDWKSWTSEAKS